MHILVPVNHIGTTGLGAYLIPTSAGEIAVNTGMSSPRPMMIEGIRSLDHKPEHVQIHLSVHAHIDHGGAIALLTEQTGASRGERLAQPRTVPPADRPTVDFFEAEVAKEPETGTTP